ASPHGRLDQAEGLARRARFHSLRQQIDQLDDSHSRRRRAEHQPADEHAEGDARGRKDNGPVHAHRAGVRTEWTPRDRSAYPLRPPPLVPAAKKNLAIPLKKLLRATENAGRLPTPFGRLLYEDLDVSPARSPVTRNRH